MTIEQAQWPLHWQSAESHLAKNTELWKNQREKQPTLTLPPFWRYETETPKQIFSIFYHGLPSKMFSFLPVFRECQP